MIFMFNHKIVESTDVDPVDYNRQKNRRLRREKYRRLSTKFRALNANSSRLRCQKSLGGKLIH